MSREDPLFWKVYVRFANLGNQLRSDPSPENVELLKKTIKEEIAKNKYYLEFAAPNSEIDMIGRGIVEPIRSVAIKLDEEDGQHKLAFEIMDFLRNQLRGTRFEDPLNRDCFMLKPKKKGLFAFLFK